ncbi:MAG TPA: hypothetical protein VF058_09605 [Actinomycetota bacterium]
MTRDPGWREAMRRLPTLLIPLGREIGISHLRTRVPAIIYVRAVFLSFVFLPYVFGAFLLLLGFPLGGAPFEPIEVGLAAAGLGGAVAAARTRSRELRADDATQAADRYVSLFFLAAALASAGAMFGFVGVFITEELWVYLPGLIGSTLALVWVAPTIRDVERRQRQISLGGSMVSLVDALLDPLPPRTKP